MDKKVKIIITYKGTHTEINGTTLLSSHVTTTVITKESYVSELLPKLINEDVEKVEVEDYNG